MSGPGILMGAGFGGFIDGIVLHQILQWHHMLSEVDPPTTLAGLEINTLADGLFHAAAWILVFGGFWWMWRSLRADPGKWASRSLLGWMATGWGLFNLIEGIVDHHLLEIHHVRSDAANPLIWDVGFLVFGALLVATGLAMQSQGPRSMPDSPRLPKS